MALDCRQDALTRLKKVEGQVRGLQRMIDEGEDCSKVIHQLCAARKALDKAGFVILIHRLRDCAEKYASGERGSEIAMEEAMSLFLTLA